MEIAEELYKRDTTYCGTIQKRRKGIPAAARDVKGRELLSTHFYWKTGSPVMCLSYVPKKAKNVLMITTAHDQPIVDDALKQFCSKTNSVVVLT